MILEHQHTFPFVLQACHFLPDPERYLFQKLSSPTDTDILDGAGFPNLSVSSNIFHSHVIPDAVVNPNSSN